MKNNRILLVVGGTGGHIYPGVVLARRLQERKKDIKIDFAVDKRPLAWEILKDYGFGACKITSAPLPRRRFWRICRFMFKMGQGFIESIILLRKIRPRVVVAFGAYISVPVVLACEVMKIPVILHEQNCFPGMANKFLTFIARKIAVSFESSQNYFPSHKTVFTGNPVRKELVEVDRHDAFDYLNLDKDRVTVLVLGGSQGSQDINLAVLGVLPYLEGMRKKIQFVHICGDKNFDDTVSQYNANRFNARVFRYMKEIKYAYSAADIIIARAGATTIAELIALGIPAILVPFPEASSQHQLLNAQPVCRIGGAICCYSEDILSGESLAVQLVPLIRDPNKRREMTLNTRVLRDKFLGAADELAELAESFLNV